jgi:hypothetical protein
MKFTVIVSVMLAASLSFGDVSYEGMDYTPGGSVAGETGGIGWSNAWTSTGVAADDAILTPGLGYTDGGSRVLITSGNADEIHPSSPGSPGYLTFTRQIDRTYGTDGDEVYISFLVNHVAETGTLDYRFQVFSGATALDIVVRGWRTVWEVAGGVTTLPKPAVGETQFMVAKITFAAGDDTVEIWQNPDLVTPGTPGYTTTVAVPSFNELRYMQQNASGHHGETNQFDEIRVGDTWAEVTPYVPEPVFGIIALLGAFALRLRK